MILFNIFYYDFKLLQCDMSIADGSFDQIMK